MSNQDYSGYYFGKYYLLEKIGSGGYADVYLARDSFLEKNVAVKVLHTRVALNNLRDIREKAHEARVMDRIEPHPNIVRFISFDLYGSIPLIVMDYAPNGSLRDLHPLGACLSWSTILHYVKQVSDALQYIHNQGFAHLDVTPGNLLLAEDYRVLLSDFGTGTFIESTHTSNVREDVVGTLNYIAPELFDHQKTPFADQYSLAAIIVEWRTGVQLFTGSKSEIIHQHLYVQPSATRLKTLGIPPTVRKVLLKALSKKPQNRYRSIIKFFEALDKAINIDERRSTWGWMGFLFISDLVISSILGVLCHFIGLKPTEAIVVVQTCLLLLPVLSSLLLQNKVAIKLAVIVPAIAAILGIILHSWLGFWWILPISLVLCSLIGFFQWYR